MRSMFSSTDDVWIIEERGVRRLKGPLCASSRDVPKVDSFRVASSY